MNTEITPFWQQIGKYFYYPIASVNALFIRILFSIFISTVQKTVLFLSFDNTNQVFYIDERWIVYPLAILVFTAIVRDCFVILLRTADGKETPPVIWTKGNARHNMLYTWHLMPFSIFIAVLITFLGTLHFSWGIIASLLILAFTPAILIALVLEENIFQALNPKRFFHVISTIGSRYWNIFVVLLSLAIIGGLIVLIKYTLIASIHNFALDFIYSFFRTFYAWYAFMASFYLIGYIIYQYHQSFGLEIKTQPVAKKPKKPQDPILEAVQQHLHAHEPEKAKAVLKKALTEVNTPLYHQKYYQLLKTTQDDYITYAENKISILLELEAWDIALPMYIDIIQKKPNIILGSAESLYTMIAVLKKRIGKQKEVRLLMEHFLRFYTDYEKTPQVTLDYAKLLCEHFHQDQKAQEVLEILLKRYPETILRTEIEEYIAFLKRLTQK